jgi:uncharacterized protein (TIRG00374 family)
MNRIDFHMDWRRWLLLAVFMALTVWVVSRFTNLKELAIALSQGDRLWIVIAVFVHLIYFVMSAKLYRLCFDVVGVESSTGHLLPVLFSAFFINTIIPSMGAAAAALFVGDAVYRGQSGARAAVGTFLVLLVDLTTLTPFVLYGLAFLRAHDLLHLYDSVTSGVFVLAILLMIVGLFLARWKPGWLRRLLGWVRRIVNGVGSRFQHPDLLAEEWPKKNAGELADAAGAIVDNPRKLSRALVWAMAMQVVNLIGLYMLFLAFRQPAPLGAMVAGFAMGIVFFVITIFPQGVAVVEAIMSLVFVSEGIPAPKAVAIVLVFRGANFYLPFLFGVFSLQYLSRFYRRTSP